MHLPREVFLSLSLSVASFGLAAAAQPAAPPPAVSADADRAARDHFTRGREAFSQGDFATAVREFSQAYELSGRPQLLYNIGATYERLHNWEEANLALTRYLERVPDAPDRAEVQARLNVIQVELQHLAEARQAPAPTGPSTSTRVVVIERRVEDPPRHFRTAFFVGAGLTALGAAATLAVGLLADKRYNDLASACGQMPMGCAEDDIADMRLRQSLVNGGLVTTGIFAAATVTFFLLDQFRPARPPVGPLPAPSARAGFAPLPGGGIFSFEGSL